VAAVNVDTGTTADVTVAGGKVDHMSGNNHAGQRTTGTISDANGVGVGLALVDCRITTNVYILCNSIYKSQNNQ